MQHTTHHYSKHLLLSLLFTVLLLLIASCSAPGQPKPIIGVVYAISGEANNPPSVDEPNLLIELMSPTNCVETDMETVFILIMKNTNPYTVTLPADQTLDMDLAEGYDWQARKYRWSQSSDYPATIDPVFAPGDERTYRWRWRAQTSSKEGKHVLSAYLIENRLSNTHLLTRAEVNIGAMNWVVGGFAGSIAISCTDVLRNTGQIAATVTAKAEK